MPADRSKIKRGQNYRKMLPWLTLVIVFATVFAVYRWAAPPKLAFSNISNGGEHQVITLHNSEFRHVVDGHVQWQLTADLVAAKRPASGVTHMIANAVLNNIHNAKVFAPPSSTRGTSKEDARPAMAFSAGTGAYSVGASGVLGSDIAKYGLAQWNFTLSSGVRLSTAQREQITAPSLSLVQYISRQTGKVQQEVICQQGATISKGTTSVHAVNLHYHPSLQSASASDGVTITIRPSKGKQSVFNTSTAFWTLRDSTVRCPNQVTGMLDGYAITANNVSLNAKVHTIAANSASINMEAVPSHENIPGAQPANSPGKSPHTKGNSTPLAGYAIVTFNPLSGNQSKGLYRGYNFTYVHKDETAKGDYAVWNSRDQLLTAKGHLVYDSNDYGATCSSAQVNRRTHERIFEGTVILTIKPRKLNGTSAGTAVSPPSTAAGNSSNQEARDHDIIVHCDKVVFSSITRIAKLTGHLLFLQNYVDKKGKKISRNATAEYAVYDDNEQTLTLYPPVRYHDSEGEVLATDDPLVISTRTNDESFTGKATTIFIPDSVLKESRTNSSQPEKSSQHPPSIEPKNKPRSIATGGH